MTVNNYHFLRNGFCKGHCTTFQHLHLTIVLVDAYNTSNRTTTQLLIITSIPTSIVIYNYIQFYGKLNICTCWLSMNMNSIWILLDFQAASKRVRHSDSCIKLPKFFHCPLEGPYSYLTIKKFFQRLPWYHFNTLTSFTKIIRAGVPQLHFRSNSILLDQYSWLEDHEYSKNRSLCSRYNLLQEKLQLIMKR